MSLEVLSLEVLLKELKTAFQKMRKFDLIFFC